MKVTKFNAQVLFLIIEVGMFFLILPFSLGLLIGPLPSTTEQKIIYVVTLGILFYFLAFIPSNTHRLIKDNPTFLPDLWITFLLSLSPTLRLEVAYARSIKSKINWVQSLDSKPGFIYVMQRADGIYKIGKTTDTKYREQQHNLDYGMGFVLIKRFAVADTTLMEALALNLTWKYQHREEGRRELRKMTKKQIETFLTEFTIICIEAVSL